MFHSSISFAKRKRQLDDQRNKSANTTLSDSKGNQEVRRDTDEDDDEDEDQLTKIVRRQRQAFSARAAAGRPSIRKLYADTSIWVVSTPVHCHPLSLELQFPVRFYDLGKLWRRRLSVKLPDKE